MIFIKKLEELNKYYFFGVIKVKFQNKYVACFF